jgi:hypothetical protein
MEKRVEGIRLKRDGSRQERLKGKEYALAISIQHQRESRWRFEFGRADSGASRLALPAAEQHGK